MDKNILIIEDDSAIVRLLTVALKTNGYNVIPVNKGISGISTYLSNHPDLVLLDMGLPDIDGMEVISQIREISSTPIIVISARGKEKEKIEALDAGADDYITKPFNVGELLARVRVALRRSSSNVYKDNIFTLDYLTVDFDKRKVTVADQEIHLTPIEFKLIKLLIDNKGKVLTHSFIHDKIWGYKSNDDYQSLRVFMASIRRKIERNTNNPRFILTDVGVGYRFADE